MDIYTNSSLVKNSHREGGGEGVVELRKQGGREGEKEREVQEEGQWVGERENGSLLTR